MMQADLDDAMTRLRQRLAELLENDRQLARRIARLQAEVDDLATSQQRAQQVGQLGLAGAARRRRQLLGDQLAVLLDQRQQLAQQRRVLEAQHRGLHAGWAASGRPAQPGSYQQPHAGCPGDPADTFAVGDPADTFSAGDPADTFCAGDVQP